MANNNTASVSNGTSATNLEVVSVTVAPAVAKAIRLLSRTDKKRTASQLADALLLSTVKSRVAQKIDKAAEEFGSNWDKAAQIMTAEKMPMPRAAYVAKSVEELRDLERELKAL